MGKKILKDCTYFLQLPKWAIKALIQAKKEKRGGLSLQEEGIVWQVIELWENFSEGPLKQYKMFRETLPIQERLLFEGVATMLVDLCKEATKEATKTKEASKEATFNETPDN